MELKQEYMFSDESCIEEINTIFKTITEGYSLNIHKIQDVDVWIFEIDNEKNTENVAIELSELNNRVLEKCNMTVLTNESAAYFNKRLYPLYNEFERKLRKFLYLSSSLCEDKKAEIIKDLESKDLGGIFSLLFVDHDFVSKCRQIMKDTHKDFTKIEILNIFKKIDENTLWDSLLGKNMVPTLRDSFDRIRIYRNDTMHAHNIDHIDYKNAKKLVERINTELDIAILSVENSSSNELNSNFNNIIYDSMVNMYDYYIDSFRKNIEDMVLRELMDDLHIKKDDDIISTYIKKAFEKYIDHQDLKDGFNQNIKDTNI